MWGHPTFHKPNGDHQEGRRQKWRDRNVLKGIMIQHLLANFMKDLNMQEAQAQKTRKHLRKGERANASQALYMMKDNSM